MASTETQTMETTAARVTALDRRLLYLLPAVVLLADQLLKLVMIAWIGRGAETHRWELAGRLVAFEYVENYGAAFGILPGQTALLTVVAVAITIGCVLLMRREAQSHPVAAIAIGLIVGGALGNLLDRVRLGYVVDFIAIGIWPKFNLADTMISIGIVLMLWSGMREHPPQHASERTANEDQHTDEQTTFSH
ncbi:MAG TPA: signal peptidase II [Thermomicrobiales bacterium]|nr:signal peptidase II [Thermomicrobiales bacterium]